MSVLSSMLELSMKDVPMAFSDFFNGVVKKSEGELDNQVATASEPQPDHVTRSRLERGK